MYGLSGFHYYSTLHFLGFNYNYNFNSAGRKSESAAAVCVCFHYSSLPDTSRKPKKGEHESRMYAFTSRSKMEADIKNGRYLEHGEYNGNLYGIKTDSIHEVVEAGRVCILDANPQVTTR